MNTIIYKTAYHYEIYEEFKRCYGTDDSFVDSWRPSVPHEIIVYLKNGNIICFENLNKTFGFVDSYEMDEYGDYRLSDDEYTRAFAKKLKRLMIISGMTQRRLSELTGINAATLSHYMTGRNLPDCRNLKRIAKALNCLVDDLMNFE